MGGAPGKSKISELDEEIWCAGDGEDDSGSSSWLESLWRRGACGSDARGRIER